MAFSPSQRVNLIKGIASRLSSAEWRVIRLTLSTFSIPWDEDYSGDPFGFVLGTVANISDGKLLELAAHLGIEVEASAAASVPSFWEAGRSVCLFAI